MSPAIARGAPQQLPAELRLNPATDGELCPNVAAVTLAFSP